MTEKADSISFKFRNIVEFSASGKTGIRALVFILVLFVIVAACLGLGAVKEW